MSLGIGVGDILSLVDQALKLYSKCKDAPAELQAAGRDLEQMRTAIQILGDATGDSMSMLAKYPVVVTVIKHEIKPLETDLHEMNDILSAYLEHSDLGLLGRLRYAVTVRSKLETVRSSLAKSRANFGLMLDLVNYKAQEQHAQNGHISLKKLDEILDKQVREAAARTDEVKARGKADAKLEEILRVLQQCRLHTTETQSTNGQSGTDQRESILNQLEQGLLEAGLSPKKARAARKSAALAIAKSDSRPTNPAGDGSIPISQVQSPKRSSPEPKEAEEALIKGKTDSVQSASPGPPSIPRSPSSQLPPPIQLSSSCQAKESSPRRPTQGSRQSSTSKPTVAPSRPCSQGPEQTQTPQKPHPVATPRRNPESVISLQPQINSPIESQSASRLHGRPVPLNSASFSACNENNTLDKQPALTLSNTVGKTHKEQCSRSPNTLSSSPAKLLNKATSESHVGLPEETKDFNILCVDNNRGVTAKLAQAYLELMRLRTANLTGRWLFRRVASAGYCLDNGAKLANWYTATKKGLDLLIPPDTFEWACGGSSETDCLVRRMRDLQQRTFTVEDLNTYHIVLSFNAADRAYIENVKSDQEEHFASDQPARIVMISCCEEQVATACSENTQKFKKFIVGLQDSLNNFISKELGDWSEPLRQTKQYRTCQHFLRRHALNKMNYRQRAEAPKLRKIAADTGCIIKIEKAYEQLASKCLSVFIIGPEDDLADAWDLVRKW